MIDNEHKELLSKAKPILFNTEMVRAILDGRKTVTRRVLKNQPCEECNDKGSNHEFIKDSDIIEGDPFTGFVCRKCGCGVSPPHGKYPVGASYIRPQYKEGDILYVRETWAELETVHGVPYWAYKADDQTLHHSSGENFERWHPSIHMPKEVARIFLRVTDVRVERLQDCGNMQAKDEGCNCCSQFARIWDSTIKKSDLDKYCWAANPWVWVIEFDVYKINQPPFGG